jgi:hypothetical protein
MEPKNIKNLALHWVKLLLLIVGLKIYGQISMKKNGVFLYTLTKYELKMTFP